MIVKSHRAPGDRGRRVPSVVAHRGAPGPWRENTTEAFRGAARMGADGVEMDVRMTADRVLVVHHDPLVEGSLPIHLSDREDLPDWVPTIEAALWACAGMDVDLEVKNLPGDPAYDPEESIAVALANAVESWLASRIAGEGSRRLMVSSFSPATLRVFRGCTTAVATGLLVHPAVGAGGMVELADELGCSVLLPHFSLLSDELVSGARARGMEVWTWTPDTRSELLDASEAGADAVITDEVARALGLFAPGLGRS